MGLDLFGFLSCFFVADFTCEMAFVKDGWVPLRVFIYPHKDPIFPSLEVTDVPPRNEQEVFSSAPIGDYIPGDIEVTLLVKPGTHWN